VPLEREKGVNKTQQSSLMQLKNKPTKRMLISNMEKQISDLTILVGYLNRQVILNYYDSDDFLWKRDGFYFERIHWINGDLLFCKGNNTTVTVRLEDFDHGSTNSDFPNYYIFSNNQERLEIYFP
jgi:hypothetical protein